MTAAWQIVIFVVEDKANHVGLNIPERGLADLSLLGARIVPWSKDRMPKGERKFYRVDIDRPHKALEFLAKPGLLCAPILQQERAARGWHLTPDAPDFVRTLRDTRSYDPEDMNCVEWIVRALELGGLAMPDDVMTPTELHDWCRIHATPIPASITHPIAD